MAIEAARATSPQAPTRTPVEDAVGALAERAQAFTEASEALRAEIVAFQAALAKAEGRPAEPGLKLVVSRETAEMEAIDQAEAAGETVEAGDGVQVAAIAEIGDGVPVAAVDEYRPTPAQIAEFFRTYGEPGELEREPTSAPAGAPPAPKERNLARERLYADIGGAVIGLSAAAALINFVLLK